MDVTREQRQKQQARDPRQDLHRALSHKLRATILDFLIDHGKSSPVEMSRELRAPVGDISHHVKQLVKYGCAEQVATRPRRGAVEHFYRAVMRPVVDVKEMDEMPLLARRVFNGHTAQKILDDFRVGFENGTIERRSDFHITRLPLSLDEEGWQEMCAVHRRAYEEAYEVQTRSTERMAKSGEQPIRSVSTQLHFELPSD
jgi:hypothetical protein